jgi:micrococcal nuclease
LLLAARSRRGPRLARRAAVALGLLAAADIAGCALTGSTPPPRSAHVMHISDGDTITIEDDGRRERLRLLGIDSPELGGPHAPGECGAVAALANLRRLADPRGRSTRVLLRANPASGDVRDRYGRLLAYADGPRGDLGEAQLRAGLARVHRHRGRRFSRLARYQRAEADARRHHRGIWTACDPPRSTADR